jgi:biopolymer transport protein ExbD
MPAPKKRRIPIAIDMTPMVDIAFLLLIFFMTTTVFKKPEEVEVQTPSSHSSFTLPETGVITITVPKSNQILMTLGDASLDLNYKLADLQGRKLVPNRYKPEDLPPIINKMQLDRRVNRVVIKADKNAEYGVVESIMTTLQKNDLNILNLVTELEEEKTAGKEGASPSGAKG